MRVRFYVPKCLYTETACPSYEYGLCYNIVRRLLPVYLVNILLEKNVSDFPISTQTLRDIVGRENNSESRFRLDFDNRNYCWE